MITGEFDAWGQPYVRCDVVLPRLNISSIGRRFLVDTGAQRTHLGARDASDMGIPISLLQNGLETVGIGGVVSNFREPAQLAFDDGRLTIVYVVELLIAEPGGDATEGIPSLLGRDLLYNWDMTYSPMRGRLEFEVLRADFVMDV